MLLPLYDDNPTRRWPVVTAILVGVNVLAFFFTATRSEHQQRVISATYGFTPARLRQVFDDQATVRVQLYDEEDPARPLDEQQRVLAFPPRPGRVLASLITAMFLHADILHLAGNMWFLMIFGNNIEDRLGRLVFPLFYLLGGVVATLIHSLAAGLSGDADHPLIGASGAVAVTLGAYIVTYPHARVRCLLFLLVFLTLLDLPAWIVLALWFGGQFLEMKLSPDVPVAYWAHIGGFALGLLAMPLLSLGLGEPARPRQDSSATPFPASRQRDF